MSTFQFTLFFVALVVAIALVLVRLLRLEARFAELARLATIEAKLVAVATTIERTRLEPLETALRDIRGDLHEIAVGVERVERAVQRVQTLALATQGASTPAAPRRPRPIPSGSRTWSSAGCRRSVTSTCASRPTSSCTRPTRMSRSSSSATAAECPARARSSPRAGAVTDVQVQTMAPMFP
jgi:hypothetical protein